MPTKLIKSREAGYIQIGCVVRQKQTTISIFIRNQKIHINQSVVVIPGKKQNKYQASRSISPV